MEVEGGPLGTETVFRNKKLAAKVKYTDKTESRFWRSLLNATGVLHLQLSFLNWEICWNLNLINVLSHIILIKILKLSLHYLFYFLKIIFLVSAEE